MLILMLSVMSSGCGGSAVSVNSPANTHRHPAEPEMVFVQGGTFRMGCKQVRCEDDEKPVHWVRLSSFYMGKYEVTQAQWETLMGTTVRQQRDKVNRDWPLRGEGGNCSMYYVSWNDARMFIERLNAATGKQYRLPTEAEWEYAARGGNKSKGNEYSYRNFVENVANELGIYDMNGNCQEWCYDWYGPYPALPRNNPTGASSGSYRVLRDGCWRYSCRVSIRSYGSPDGNGWSLGFRLACSSK
jgi:formylglycine-generating enzyme required for sulfatase activity